MLPDRVTAEVTDAFEVRPVSAYDLHCIVDTWVKSLGSYAPYSRLSPYWFNPAQRFVARKILERAQTLVASPRGDPEQIYGYIVFDADERVLYWIYTKYHFRQLGVGTRLLNEAFSNFRDEPIFFTTHTTAMHHQKKNWNAFYKPKCLRRVLVDA